MSAVTTPSLEAYCRQVAQQARLSSRELALASTEAKNGWLRRSADLLERGQEEILAANAKDLAAAPDFGLSASQIDRLTLTPSRIAAMAGALLDHGDLHAELRCAHRADISARAGADDNEIVGHFEIL